MRLAILFVVLVLALSGCTGKDKLSQGQMEAQAKDALQHLSTDIDAGGAISGADLSIPIDAGFGIITIPMRLEFGPTGDMLLTGSFGNPLSGGRMTAAIYCSSDRVVIVTSGIESVDPDSEDISAELRNPRGSCTQADPDTLGAFGGLTRLLEVNSLEAKNFKQLGKGHFDATYRDDAADLVVEIQGKRVQRIAAISDDGELSATFQYGTREALTVPEADTRWPIPVEWEGRNLDGGHRLTTSVGEGPIEDYTIRIYSNAVAVPCSGGPAPLANFALAEGFDQTQAGFSMRFVDNGDGVLGADDWAWLEHPDKLERGWHYKVEVWDDWSDTSADSVCFIPGAPTGFVIGGLVLLAAGRRYW